MEYYEVPDPSYQNLSPMDFEILEEACKPIDKKDAKMWVYKVKRKTTGNIYCLKKMQKNGRQDIQLFLNQLRVLYQLQHPHIIELYSHFEDEQYVYALYEYMDKTLKKENKALSTEESLTVFVQICRAVKYMHKQKYMHRDINLSNIMLKREENGKITAKLIDFEYTVGISTDRYTQVGTLQSLAPEVVLQAKQDEKIDVWGLGVVLYNLIMKNQPFLVRGKEAYEETVRKIKNVEYEQPTDAKMQDLLKRVFVLDPLIRCTVEDILNHPILKDYYSSTDDAVVEQHSDVDVFEISAFDRKQPETESFQEVAQEHKLQTIPQFVDENPKHRELREQIRKLEAQLSEKRNSKPPKTKEILAMQKKVQDLDEQFCRAQNQNEILKQKLKQSEIACMKYEKQKRTMDEQRLSYEKAKLQFGKISNNVKRVQEENDKITERIAELQKQLQRVKREESEMPTEERQRPVMVKQSPSNNRLFSREVKQVSAFTTGRSQERKEEMLRSAKNLK